MTGPCDRFRVSRYRDGEIVGEERLAFEEHLATCQTCQRTVAEYHRIGVAIRALPMVAAPADLRANVFAHVAPTRRAPLSWWQPMLAGFVATAAALLLVVWAAGLVAQLPGAEPPETANPPAMPTTAAVATNSVPTSLPPTVTPTALAQSPATTPDPTPTVRAILPTATPPTLPPASPTPSPAEPTETARPLASPTVARPSPTTAPPASPTAIPSSPTARPPASATPTLPTPTAPPPSPTAAPATATPPPAPSVTPTPNVAIARIPTATPTPCVPIEGRFARFLAENPTVQAALRCAFQPAVSGTVAEATFQRGTLLRRSDNQQVFVLVGGQWSTFTDARSPDPGTAVVGEPSPPLQAAYRTRPALQAQLGAVTEDTRTFTGTIQPFEGGLLIGLDRGVVLALYANGSFERRSDR